MEPELYDRVIALLSMKTLSDGYEYKIEHHYIVDDGHYRISRNGFALFAFGRYHDEYRLTVYNIDLYSYLTKVIKVKFNNGPYIILDSFEELVGFIEEYLLDWNG